jgi:SAM-dependent methyltransferase
MNSDEARRINQQGWDRRVAEADLWTVPVSPDEIARARAGDWSVVLTPIKPVPTDWFGGVTGKDILCLASGGGQQGPILAAAGARVTVLDASAAQLAQDARVAEREGLVLTLVQGFMHDLSVLADASFDLIFHPVSNCYAPEIEPVWRECFRVLRPGGALLAAFNNPAVYIFDPQDETRDGPVAHWRLPYSDADALSPETLAAQIDRDHTIEYSHMLDTQIGGQLRARFLLAGLYEDADRGPPDQGWARFFPKYIATRSIKL